MGVPFNQVFFPSALAELFSAWAKCPDAVPFAGGTDIMLNGGRRLPDLPPNVLCLDRIADLRRVTRTERYLEVGAMVTLNEIIYLGKAVPEALTRSLEGIAGPQVRNIATIGGTVCCRRRFLDPAAPLIGLEALYELRGAASSRWVSASRFAPLPGNTALAPQELLTRIRVPLAHWDYAAYKKFKRLETGGEEGGAVFLIRSEKNTLTDLRVVFAGALVLRDKNSESLLVGKRLPLDRRDIADFLAHWDVFFAGASGGGGLFRTSLLHFIEKNLDVLRE
jgi:CO/xanthine dehydrogenase FAD-binding subunit